MMTRQFFVVYLLCGAFLMLLLGGGAVLVCRPRSDDEAVRAKNRMCRLVGAMMLLYFVAILVDVVETWHAVEASASRHTMPCDGSSPALFLGNVLLFSVSTPLLYMVSHTIRYSRYPSPAKVAAQCVSLLFPLAYLVWRTRLVFLLTLMYVVVYSVVVFVHHALWFRWHRDLWARYNDLYRRQSVWMLWLILVPIEIHAVLYVVCFAMPSPGAFCGYLVAAIVLWTAAFHRTYLYRPCPFEEQGCIDIIDPPVAAATQLPPPLRTQIGLALRRAEEERLHLRQDVNLDIYAQYVGTNRTYVSRYFNQELNTTFCDYVNRLRLDYAKQLLQSEDRVRIADVAFRCGYADVSTFRRNFKKYEGRNPRELRVKN